MDFVVEDRIAAPLGDVERVMFDRDTLESIPAAVQGIESVTVCSLTNEGVFLERVLHYRPSLNLPRFAMRVPREHIEWTERLRWNTEEHRGEMVITPNMPDALQKYFRAGGTVQLSALDATHTLRRMASYLTVEYGAMAGAIAGRIAIGIIKRHFVREGRMLEVRARGLERRAI